jgi:hypothetical protein
MTAKNEPGMGSFSIKQKKQHLFFFPQVEENLCQGARKNLKVTNNRTPQNSKKFSKKNKIFLKIIL